MLRQAAVVSPAEPTDDERTRPAPRDTDRAKFGIGGLASHYVLPATSRPNMAAT
jgi:hypothetical protein